MKKLLGIDIGSHELKIAECDGKNITKLVSAEVPANLMKNGEIVSYEVCAQFIKDTLKENNISCKNVCVILPENQVFLKQTIVPYMDKKKLLINIPYELHDYLSSEKEEYIYDYSVNETINNEKNTPIQLDITAAAVSKEIISNYTQMFKKAGLKMMYAIPNESTFTNIIKLDKDNTAKEYAFVDAAHMGTRLFFYTGAKYETTRIIDRGLKSVGEAIAAAENTTEAIALADMKANKNNVLNTDAARDIFGSAVTEVRRAINFYSLNKQNSTLNDVYLCGGGAGIGQMDDALTKNLDVKVHLAEVLFPTVLCEADNLSKYTCAIGAAIQDDGMNLISRDKDQFRPTVVVPSIVLVIVAVALFAKFGIFDRYEKLWKYQAEASALSSYNSEMKNSLSDYDSIQEKYNKYSTKFMSDTEKEIIDRTEMLSLIEEEFLSAGRVMSMTSNGTVITVELAGVTLEDTSKLIDVLQARDDVSYVSISTATAEETVEISDETATDDETDTADTDVSNDSLITITVVMN